MVIRNSINNTTQSMFSFANKARPCETFFHKLVHHTNAYADRSKTVTSQSQTFVKTDRKILTPEVNELVVKLFKDLPEDLHESIKVLHDRAKDPQLSGLITYIEHCFTDYVSHEEYLPVITQTALGVLGNPRSYSQVREFARESLETIENKYLNLFKTIKSGSFRTSPKSNEFIKFSPEEKSLKQAINKFSAYKPLVDIKQFVSVFIFGGMQSDFFNNFHKILKRNNMISDIQDTRGLEGTQVSAIESQYTGWVTYDDLKKFSANWPTLGTKEKEEIFHAIFGEMISEYSGPQVEEATALVKERVRQVFTKLESWARRFHNSVTNPNIKQDQKGYQITRILLEMNQAMGADKLDILDSIVSEIIKFDNTTSLPSLNTEETREQLRKNNKEIVNGIVTGIGKMHHGFSSGEQFANAKTIKATVLNKEYLSGLLWAKNLIGKVTDRENAEKMLDSKITEEGAKLAQLPAGDHVQAAMIRHHLFNFLFLNSILHASAVYVPPMRGGKVARGAEFETIVIDFLRKEFRHYSIPQNLVEDFEMIAKELIDTENFRYIRTKADLMRRELAENYAIHLLGFKIKEKLTPEQVNEIAEQVYDLIYAYGTKSFAVRDKKGAQGVFIPDIQKNDILDIIKQEITKRNDEIVKAAKENPSLRIEQLPINWRNIMSSEEDHADKFFNQTPAKPVVSFSNHINVKPNKIDPSDLVYLKWLISQGTI